MSPRLELRKPVAFLLGRDSLLLASLLWLQIALASAAFGGGSGLNTVVVVNQRSARSVELGNYYLERRGLPPEHLFRMTAWDGGAISWTLADFERCLRSPLLNALRERGLTNQIQFVLLSMDIPYRVVDGLNENSTTSCLFYGFKTNTVAPDPSLPVTCSLPQDSTNLYALSELPFDVALPHASSNCFLAMLITQTNLTDANDIIERAAASDGTFPVNPVYLLKTSDAARNVRFLEFDNAIFESRLLGDSRLVPLVSDATQFSNAGGMQTGLRELSLPADAFIPGAIADTLTSFAGGLFEDQGQTTMLSFLAAGAAATYGTIVEPCNYLEKFPDPLVYFYQSRGFNAAEAYYQSVRHPYQGLFMGDPLAAPFAAPGLGRWLTPTNSEPVAGRLLIEAEFLARDANHPLDRVDLFVDGLSYGTLTNVAPAFGNLLSVNLNGTELSLPVAQGATMSTLSPALAGLINARSNEIAAFAEAFGDRIVLRSLQDSNGLPFRIQAQAKPGSAPMLTMNLAAASEEFMPSEAHGVLAVSLTNPLSAGDWLNLEVTKSDGQVVSLGVTNSSPQTDLRTMADQLMSAINAHPLLQGSDGIFASDLNPVPFQHLAEFFLNARGTGFEPAQARVRLRGSPNINIRPRETRRLDDNLSDLQSRNHLYVRAGLTNLVVHQEFDTRDIPDGEHEFTLVAYEGTSTRTQTRATAKLTVRNHSLSADLISSGGTFVTVDAEVQLRVSTRATNIGRIQLFGTGGEIQTITNQASASFDVPLAMLGPGSHLFYSVVSDEGGNRFRTPTVPLIVLPSLHLRILPDSRGFEWNTARGQIYEIQSAERPDGPFSGITNLVSTKETLQWPFSKGSAPAAFYRVRIVLIKLTPTATSTTCTGTTAAAASSTRTTSARPSATAR